MILNPVVPVYAPIYAQDHAQARTITSSYITDDPQEQVLIQS
jgi:hypothetical protein